MQNIIRTSLTKRGLCFALASSAALLVSPAVFAQVANVPEEIIVIAPPHADRSATRGVPSEHVTLAQSVAYDDLDLTTPAGSAELDKRVAAAARSACERLSQRYPIGTPDTVACRKLAMADAQGQIDAAKARREAIASATVQTAAAPKPAVPLAIAPVVAIPSTAPIFVVYFATEGFDLDSAAQAVVKNAAIAAESGVATKATVVGYTDTTGTNDYNYALSERRANAVATALTKLGMSQSAQSVNWKGEMELAVSGGRANEQLNRRVTIEIRPLTQ